MKKGLPSSSINSPHSPYMTFTQNRALASEKHIFLASHQLCALSWLLPKQKKISFNQTTQINWTLKELTNPGIFINAYKTIIMKHQGSDPALVKAGITAHHKIHAGFFSRTVWVHAPKLRAERWFLSCHSWTLLHWNHNSFTAGSRFYKCSLNKWGNPTGTILVQEVSFLIGTNLW